MTMLRMATVTVALCALCLAFAAGGADATRTVRIASHISIKDKELRFHGRVTSPNVACRANRRVALYQRLSDGGRRRLGHTVTGSSGKWHIRISGFAGVSLAHFYAKVSRRREGT